MPTIIPNTSAKNIPRVVPINMYRGLLYDAVKAIAANCVLSPNSDSTYVLIIVATGPYFEFFIFSCFVSSSIKVEIPKNKNNKAAKSFI